MPPQDQKNQNPTSQFDFMFKQQPKPPKKFNFLAGKSMPIKILAGVIALFIVVTIVAVVGSRGSTSINSNLVALRGRSEEIVRISKIVEKQVTDSNTLAIVSTTEATMTSTDARITAVLSKSKIKASPKDLAAYTDKTTDVQMQTAAQNNNLAQAYLAYLNSALQKYQTTLKAAAKQTKSANTLSILNDSYVSNNVLLSSSLVQKSGS